LGCRGRGCWGEDSRAASFGRLERRAREEFDDEKIRWRLGTALGPLGLDGAKSVALLTLDFEA